MKEFIELKKLLLRRRELARQQMEFWRRMIEMTPMSELKLAQIGLLDHWRGRYSMCKKTIIMVENWLAGYPAEQGGIEGTDHLDATT